MSFSVSGHEYTCWEPPVGETTNLRAKQLHGNPVNYNDIFLGVTTLRIITHTQLYGHSQGLKEQDKCKLWTQEKNRPAFRTTYFKIMPQSCLLK